MAQLFNNDLLDYLSRADITSARFEIDVTWSLCIFIRVENLVTDERVFFSKWDDGDANGRQVRLRTNTSGAIEVGTDANTATLAFGTVAINTWYLVVLSNDGGGGATGLSGFQYSMDGTEVDSGSNQHDGTSPTQTFQLEIGRRPLSDPFDGDIAYCAYFNTELTAAERLAYLRNPYQIAFAKGSTGCEFFLPMYGDDSPEPELVHGRNFTVNGTQVKGTNPPLGPLAPAARPFTAAAAPVTANSSLGFMVPQ